jgi:hypothetical protein
MSKATLLPAGELLAWLRRYRLATEHKETIVTTAAAIDVSRPTLLRWLKGSASPRSASQIRQLQAFLERQKESK